MHLKLLFVTLALSLVVLGICYLKTPVEPDLDEFLNETGWVITTNTHTDGSEFFGHPQESMLVAKFAKPYVAYSASANSREEDLIRTPGLARKALLLSLANSEALTRRAADLLRFFPNVSVVAVHESISEAELRKLASDRKVMDIWVISPEHFLELRARFRELEKGLHLKKRLCVLPQIERIR